MRSLTYIEAIREGTAQVLREDPSVILIGEGVPDPKAIFGTTKGLQEEFGSERVFDMPVSENGMTGVCIGAAIAGLKPIIVHQRIDFTLYAMDQIVNNAAKWFSMFGGKAGNVPLVMRAIVGRGWGAGNQHSQNLSHLFAMIPGLKVVTPSSAKDAKDLLVWAVREPNPVMFIEHRWLQSTSSYFSSEVSRPEKEVKAKVVIEGDSLTLISWSYMTVEAIKIADLFKEFLGIKIEVIDMRSLNPLDMDTVKNSVQKTHNVLIIEEAWKFNSLSSEIITQLYEDHSSSMALNSPAVRITLPDCYAPSTPHLTKYYYPTTHSIACKILDMLYIESPQSKQMLETIAYKENNKPHDVPDANYRGPF